MSPNPNPAYGERQLTYAICAMGGNGRTCSFCFGDLFAVDLVDRSKQMFEAARPWQRESTSKSVTHVRYAIGGLSLGSGASFDCAFRP
jgi:hypothetical protein